MKTFELFIGDLKPSVQEDLKAFLGGNNGNYDVIPLASITSEDDEESEDDAPSEVPEPITTMPVRHCVVITHSFSTEGTQVYEYDSCEDATKGLERLYDLYLVEERSNNSQLNEAETFYDGEEYAKITWAGEAGDRTEFIVSCIWKEV